MRTIVPVNGFEVAVEQSGDPNASMLALWSPGRVETKDHPHIQLHLKAAAELGYLAVAFDPPGTGESSGTDTDINMKNNVEAMQGLIEVYGNRPTVALGHSRGGTVAMITAMRTDPVVGFAAVMSRPSRSKPKVNLEEVSEQIERVFDYVLNREREYVLGRAFFEDTDQYNILEGLAVCTKPKLFIYGEKDTIVEPKAVIEGFDAAAYPKELVAVDAEHHYRRQTREIIRVIKPVSAFLIKLAESQRVLTATEAEKLVASLRPLQSPKELPAHS